MRMLILGGTGFLGRHLVEAALARGHEPTLFHRGRTGAGLFPELEHVLGDRDGGLDLRGHWDAAIDTCGYVPRVVGASAHALEPLVEHLTFVSTISVYADFSRAGTTEESALSMLDDEGIEEVDGATYGPLKAICERRVGEVFGERGLIVRPGLIVGPHDATERFPYWVERIAAGGDVLAPGAPEAPVQLIDARDLARWTIAAIEERRGGVYHATGPRERTSLGQLLEACVGVARSGARLCWVDGEFLVAQGVVPWGDLPLWVHYPWLRGANEVDVTKALAAGLELRPIEETIRDTLAWTRTRDAGGARKAGLDRARESELLSSWESWAGQRRRVRG